MSMYMQRAEKTIDTQMCSLVTTSAWNFSKLCYRGSSFGAFGTPVTLGFRNHNSVSNTPENGKRLEITFHRLKTLKLSMGEFSIRAVLFMGLTGDL